MCILNRKATYGGFDTSTYQARGSQLYPGTIVKEHEGIPTRYDIKYDDGDFESGVLVRRGCDSCMGDCSLPLYRILFSANWRPQWNRHVLCTLNRPFASKCKKMGASRFPRLPKPRHDMAFHPHATATNTIPPTGANSKCRRRDCALENARGLVSVVAFSVL